MCVCLRTFCNRSASALVVADQTFMVGPGVSPVPVRLVSQIVAGKYVDLCELLPANLQVKEPEPQLQLFNFHAAGASVLACVASASSRVIARNLEREQKKMEGGGGREKRKRLPANPTILKNAPNCFHASMHLQFDSLSSK